MNRTPYNEIKAINQSALKEVAKSPAHFMHYWKHGREATPAMSFGSAVHCLILEPEKFGQRYFVFDERERPEPDKDFRIKTNREWKAGIYESNPGKKFITLDDYKRAEAMRDNCMAIPAIREILTMPGEFESVHTWKDEEFGLPCKGITDKWAPDGRIIADLKTCESAHPDKFTRDIFKYDYPLQAAFYTDGWKAKKYYIIAVENKAPHCPFLYLLDEDIIEFGRNRYRRYLKAIKDCNNMKRFPGYEYWLPAGTYSPEVPAWAERTFN